MQWEFIVALVVAIPIILFPAAFIWYVNIGGLYTMIRERRKKKAAAKERSREIAGGQTVVIRAVAQRRHEVKELTGVGS
jgi:preprotein translocase subunit YajC